MIRERLGKYVGKHVTDWLVEKVTALVETGGFACYKTVNKGRCLNTEYYIVIGDCEMPTAMFGHVTAGTDVVDDVLGRVRLGYTTIDSGD